MAKIAVGIDWINGTAPDSKLARKVVDLLNQKGHTATYVGWGPNIIQSYARNNSVDLMVQIAGGKCIGTAGDFYVGIKSYYKAKAAGFMYYNCWSATWPARREPRDHFSNIPGTAVKREVDAVLGKTLPEIYKLWENMYYGYGSSAEELVNTFLANYGGNSSDTTGATAQAQGSTIIDIIKEVMSDWDAIGGELTLNGDTVNIRKTNMNSATVLTDDRVINNSETYNDYDVSTPNSYSGNKDDMLVDRFGEKVLDDTEITDTSNPRLLLQLAQRGHGHSIDLKCILHQNHMEGKWVKLTHHALQVIERYYYITKCTMDEERVCGLTLEPGPPSRYVEVEEFEEEVTDDTETDDGDDT